MSCARTALHRSGFEADKYYASEIDKYAIKVTQDNYPDTVQLGNIKGIVGNNLPKINLMVAGFPCQGFSFAGKQLNFNDTRSALFFEAVRILKECDADYFLFENVLMKKEYQDVISDLLGVQPIKIDSALLSAQVRKRLYWTNIPNVKQPEDKNLFIEDILENPAMIPVIKSHGELIYKPHKAQCLDANYWKGADNHGQRTGCIEVGHAVINGHDFLKRVYSPKGKCPTLTAVCGGNQERKIAVDASHWRKLTPVECERLQTVPDGYTKSVSNSQRYKMLGNGMTVDVIAHILKGMRYAL